MDKAIVTFVVSSFKIKKRYLHSVDKFPLIQVTTKSYTVVVICGDSWLDSCDVVVPI